MASIRKRGKSYCITVSCGYDARGKQLRRYLTWRPPESLTRRQTEKELIRRAALFEEECRFDLLGGDVKFEDLVRRWFEQYAEPNLKARTVERYHQMEGRILCYFGNIRVRDITTRLVQNFLTELGREGENRSTGGTLSPKTIRNHLSFMSSIFGWAASQGIARENPCRYARPPQLSHAELPCYSQEEAQKFLAALEGEPLVWRVYFSLAIFGGFRRGEILGLEWRDIDFSGGIVTINRTSLYTSEKGIFTDTPKTKKSRRSLKMPDSVIALMRHFHEQSGKQAAERLFTARNGTPLNPTRVENWLTAFQQRAGLRKINLHSLRHLNATLLISGGADIKTVSAALGHSSVTTTLDIYAHAVSEAQARATAALADSLALQLNDK